MLTPEGLKDKPVPQEPKVRKKVAIQNPHISPHRKNNPQLATTENTGLATMPEDLSDSAASSVPKAFVIPQLDSTRGGGSVFEIEDASISRLDRQSDSGNSYHNFALTEKTMMSRKLRRRFPSLHPKFISSCPIRGIRTLWGETRS